MKKTLLILLLTAFFLKGSFYLYANDTNDISIVNCSSDTTCEIKTYRSDIPKIFSSNNLFLAKPFPTGTSDIVNISLNGSVSAVSCNGSWQDMPTSSDNSELQNRIKCVVNDDKSSITADVRVYNQLSFSNTYSGDPLSSSFAYLNNTSSFSPYCTSQVAPDNATACQWIEYINEDEWIIISKTDAYALTVGEEGNVNGGSIPEGSSICVSDTDEDKWDFCVETDDKKNDLCPINLVSCTATNSEPICSMDGFFDKTDSTCKKDPERITCLSDLYTYNPQTDKCERDPYCSDGGLFNKKTESCEIDLSATCLEGYSFDKSAGSCIKTVACTTGIYDPETDTCVSNADQSCSNGGTADSSGNCIKNPCENGGSYDSSLKICTASTVSGDCPQGYTEENGVCIQTPICSSPGVYNPTTNRCETSTSVQSGSCVRNEKYKIYVNKKNTVKVDSCSAGSIKLISGYGESWETLSYSYSNNFLFGSTVTIFYKNYFYNSGGILGDFNSGHLTPVSGEYNGTAHAYAHEVFCSVVENIPAPGVKPRKDYYNVYYDLWAVDDSVFACYLNNDPSGDYDTESKCNTNCFTEGGCPEGYSNNAGLCTANPFCTNGGTFNSNSKKCEIPLEKSCIDGFSYDQGLSKCVKAPCIQGYVLNTTTNLCEIPSNKTCPPDYTLNGLICRSSLVCNNSVYHAETNTCRINITDNCPPGYTFNNENGMCESSYICFNNSVYSQTAGMCTLNAEHVCEINYSYNYGTKSCEAIPICEAGAFNPETNSCYEGENTCPYGPGYDCFSYGNKNMCSPLSCVNIAENEEDDDTTEGENDPDNDGVIGDDGVCQDNLYLFSGKDKRCRSWGLKLIGSGCCNKNTYLMGTMNCKDDEKHLSKLKNTGVCHYVGEYTSKKINLGIKKVKAEQKKTYCCFNSKLARIIHEQGRPQLKPFSSSNWGTAKDPVCRGFTPEEFQMLDFQKIDLQEYAGDIQVKSTEAMGNELKNAVINKNFTP